MEPEKKSNGALIGLIIIIIILVIGGIYIWESNKKAIEKMEESSTATDKDSDFLDSLEADVEATDTSTGVDANAVY